MVTPVDLAVSPLPSLVIREADLIAFHLPMHTATRLAVPAIDRVKRLNPAAQLCAYGLYAPLNESYLRDLGVETIVGGEFESFLAELAGGRPPDALVSLERLHFLTPDRAGLPGLARYAKLHVNGECRVVGYTEASRGCKHLCRHCPVVPVYQGSFRVIPQEVVLADIGHQVAAGARHITFGDPDFFNGPAHAVRIVEALQSQFPGVTYDVTIKIAHLLHERSLLPVLARTGCAFVTSAVETTDDSVLDRLAKGHTRADFIEAVALSRASGLVLSPTFIPFTPWTTRSGYLDLLDLLVHLELVDHVSPIQLALRLLIPAGSRLLELDEIRALVGQYDRPALLYHWRHPDPEMDTLAAAALHLVNECQRERRPRREIFAQLYELAAERPPDNFDLMPRATVPYLDEPWYC
jgi:radical SAM superfamily enzyme YgiQ (UPF0313 family)